MTEAMVQDRQWQKSIWPQSIHKEDDSSASNSQSISQPLSVEGQSLLTQLLENKKQRSSYGRTGDIAV
ncbi:hypothetical protein QTO34_018154 [Cnephaeus nilssonii]|uniref:Uncharacterized protein n=1 Tax=Cnephaeus nilssonii TaxID=3371016 RepID=A0AA40LMT6_CNENI|nr:hypothetical protein QTO34_018154 [Eptesicus nilssonii]